MTTTTPATCTEWDCKRRPAARHGLCRVHRGIELGTAKGCTATLKGDSCNRLQHARQLCGMHLGQVTVHGHVVSIEPAPGRERAGLSGPARFAAKLNNDAEAGCWTWDGYISDDGYGRFFDSGKSWRAHRWAWSHLGGSLPQGMGLDHICGTILCCRPGHMQLVTAEKHREITRRRREALKASPGDKFYAPNQHRTWAELGYAIENGLLCAMNAPTSA